jgi:hypothetical protein
MTGGDRRGHEGKHAFSSWELAERMALDLMEAKPDGRSPIVAYRCKVCDLWHIGHLSKPRKVASRGSRSMP